MVPATPEGLAVLTSAIHRLLLDMKGEGLVVAVEPFKFVFMHEGADGKPRHGYGTLAVMVPERPFEVVPEHAPEVERRIRETVESLLLS